MTIRLLSEADAERYREVRLRALEQESHAFLASWEEEREWPLEETRTRLRALAGHPTNAIFGAFRGDALVGTIGLEQEPSRKARHRAHLWGFYVLPHARREGHGAQLMTAALARARANGVEQVHLAVVATATEARALYVAHGFALVGVLPRAIRASGIDLDEHLMVCFLETALAAPRVAHA